MLPAKVRNYLFVALESTPVVLSRLLLPFDSGDPIYDRRPDPARFTLRQMLAHVADWDEIFLERIQRTVAEDVPTLPDRDEGAIAIERDYELQDPAANLRRLTANRTSLVNYVKALPQSALLRIALRPELGELTVEDQVVMIVAHDGYHTKQTAEYAAGIPPR